jgi:hypothetical protein
MPTAANDNRRQRAVPRRFGETLRVKLNKTEWLQLEDACKRLGLNRTDAIRLAVDDLLRSPRLKPPADDHRPATVAAA